MVKFKFFNDIHIQQIKNNTECNIKGQSLSIITEVKFVDKFYSKAMVLDRDILIFWMCIFVHVWK